MTVNPRWKHNAACVDQPWQLFFPDKGGSPEDAKTICSRCPVRDTCLDYALDWTTSFGVWGGTTAAERIELRRKRREAAA